MRTVSKTVHAKDHGNKEETYSEYSGPSPSLCMRLYPSFQYQISIHAKISRQLNDFSVDTISVLSNPVSVVVAKKFVQLDNSRPYTPHTKGRH